MVKEPDNEKVYFNLGMLAMDDRDFLKAEAWFKKAIQVGAFLWIYHNRET